jgi:hypothetical protein
MNSDVLSQTPVVNVVQIEPGDLVKILDPAPFAELPLVSGSGMMLIHQLCQLR